MIKPAIVHLKIDLMSLVEELSCMQYSIEL